jgi:hypothetical protein
MATNFVSLVLQMLTPNLVGRIASALGIDRTLATRAVEAAAPAVLGSLAGVAATPEGGRRLFDAVTQQPANPVEQLIRSVGTPDQTAIADRGTNLLSSLLGSSGTTGMAEAISRFTGLGGAKTSSLLGMLMPVVLGALGQQQRASGLDSAGLSQFLAGQKDNISAAMPPELGNLLSGTGLLGGLGTEAAAGTAKTARTATESASRPQVFSAPPSAHRAPEASSWVQSLYWAIPLAAIAALGLWYFSRPGGEHVAEAPAPARVAEPAPAAPAPAPAPAPRAAEGATPAPASVPEPTQTGATRTAPVGQEQALATLRGVGAGGAEAANQISTTLGTLTSSLQGIQDTATAEAAVPRLRDAITQLDRVRASTAQMPVEGQRALAGVVASALPTLNPLLDKVLAVPGGGAIVKPVVDDLRPKLQAMSTT